MKTKYRGITYSEVTGFYRATVGINGEVKQLYSKTIDQALSDLAKLRKERDEYKTPYSNHTKKREGCIDPDLPPGYHSSDYWEQQKHGEVLRQRVSTSITKNGIIVRTFSKTYGEKITKQEALEIVMEKRKEYCLKHELFL